VLRQRSDRDDGCGGADDVDMSTMNTTVKTTLRSRWRPGDHLLRCYR